MRPSFPELISNFPHTIFVPEKIKIFNSTTTRLSLSPPRIPNLSRTPRSTHAAIPPAFSNLPPVFSRFSKSLDLGCSLAQSVRKFWPFGVFWSCCFAPNRRSQVFFFFSCHKFELPQRFRQYCCSNLSVVCSLRHWIERHWKRGWWAFVICAAPIELGGR